MAEKLTELRQKGGGNNGIDLINPDVVEQLDLNTGATRNISVTTLPKYIVITYSRAANSTDRSGIEVYDVSSGHMKKWAYTSNGYLTYVDSSAEEEVQSVSSSSVVIYNIHSWPARYEILIYY